MALFLQYLRGKRRGLLLGCGFWAVFLGSFWLYHLPLEAVVYPAVLCAILGALFLIWDFLRIRHHQCLQQIHTMTDVLAGTLPAAESVQMQDYQQILHCLAREHQACCIQTEQRYENMINYYTVWVHQIKTPIASMRLQLQNEDTPKARALMAELFRVEQYVEMVLTFLRLDADSTDYVFRECDLDAVVRQAVKKFTAEFIGRKLKLDYQPLNTTVVTDEKWLLFVVEQVLSNALKYTPRGTITITLLPAKTLRIQDTGIGIAPEDLPRIFENGYTGYNGRTDKKASGIGLYLCKRICRNLGHTITAKSQPDVGTIIDIDLAQRSLEVE